MIPTTGLQAPSNVTIRGSSFGSARDMVRDVRVGDRRCNVDEGWVSDTSIVCGAPGPGVGRVAVSVTVASQTCGSSCAALDFKYASPLVSDIKAASLPLAPDGGGVLTVVGSGFGFQSGQATVSLGATECTKTWYLADSLVLCTPPAGAGAHLQLTVDVGGQRWVGDAGVDLHYATPALSSIFPRLLPRGGEAVVTMRGTSIHLNSGDYEAVWILTEPGFPREHVTAIMHIAQIPGGRDVEITASAPRVSAAGPAAVFLRAAGDQRSNRLFADCDVAAYDGPRVCLHFGNPSPLLSIRVQTTRGGEHGITMKEGTLNTSAWKTRFASLLGMPSDEHIFILSIESSDASLEARGRRRPVSKGKVSAAMGLDGGRGQGRGRGLKLAPGQRGLGWRSQLRQDGESLEEVQEEGAEAAPAQIFDLSMEVYFIARYNQPRTCRAFIQALQSQWASETGRRAIQERLGITLLEVSTEEVADIFLADPIDADMQALDGYACVGGSRAGAPCVEDTCPGGKCSPAGGVSNAFAAWKLGAIAGACAAVVCCLLAMGVKVCMASPCVPRLYNILRLAARLSLEEPLTSRSWLAQLARLRKKSAGEREAELREVELAMQISQEEAELQVFTPSCQVSPRGLPPRPPLCRPIFPTLYPSCIFCRCSSITYSVDPDF